MDDMAMNNREIARTVEKFINENFVYADDARPDIGQSLLRTGIIDSTGALELVEFLESTFAIRIAEHEMVTQNLDSIGKMAAFVERKRAA
jgi:acyl carrier protein